VYLQFWFKDPYQPVFRHLSAQKIMLISFLHSNYTTTTKAYAKYFYLKLFQNI
jgi:hypothetical protein